MMRRDDDVEELLKHLDHPPPRVSVDALVARARPPRRWRFPSVAAATVVIASIAAALPSSPVRRAVLDVIGDVSRSMQGSRSPVVSPAPPAPQGAGVSLVAHGPLTVRFLNARSGTRVLVMIVPAPQLSLLADGGDASFAVNDGGIAVTASTTSSFRLVVPDTLSVLSLESDGAVMLEKRGTAVTTRARRDSLGAYIVELGQSRR